MYISPCFHSVFVKYLWNKTKRPKALVITTDNTDSRKKRLHFCELRQVWATVEFNTMRRVCHKKTFKYRRSNIKGS